jgi:hypothetical protein
MPYSLRPLPRSPCRFASPRRSSVFVSGVVLAGPVSAHPARRPHPPAAAGGAAAARAARGPTKLCCRDPAPSTPACDRPSAMPAEVHGNSRALTLA